MKKKIHSPRAAFVTGANISLIVLATLAVVAGAALARPILFPVALATMLALAVKPVARVLGTKLKIPPIITSALIVLTIISVVCVGVFALSGPASKWIGDAPKKFNEVERKIRPVKESVVEITEAAGKIDKITEPARDPDKLKVEVARPTLTSTVLGATAEVGLEFVIAISFLFLLLAFGDDFLERIANLEMLRGREADLLSMIRNAEEMISRYLFRFTLINIGLGIVIGLGMWAIGMPNPALWGVMAACFNFVPYIGLITGTIIVFLAAVVEMDSLWTAALAPAIYLIANSIEANAVTPSLLGRALSVHVIILFFGILLLGWMWGIGGVLIAVPLMATARVVCDHVDVLKPIGRLLGSDSVDREIFPEIHKN